MNNLNIHHVTSINYTDKFMLPSGVWTRSIIITQANGERFDITAFSESFDNELNIRKAAD